MLSKEFMDRCISQEDCALYIPLTYRMFHYFNGIINTIFKFPKLEIIPFATNYSYNGDANHYKVTIYLGNIIKSYDEGTVAAKAELRFRRHDWICSRISSALIHELFHIDQIRYDDPSHIFEDEGRGAQGYQIEGAVDLKVDEFEIEYASTIGNEFGFTYIYADEKTVFETTPFIYEYRRLPNIEAAYKQLLNASLFINDFGLHNLDILDYYGAENNIIINIIDINGVSRIIHVKVNGQFTEYGVYELVNILDYIDRYNLNGNKEFLDTEFGVEIRITLFSGNYYPLINSDE